GHEHLFCFLPLQQAGAGSVPRRLAVSRGAPGRRVADHLPSLAHLGAARRLKAAAFFSQAWSTFVVVPRNTEQNLQDLLGAATPLHCTGLVAFKSTTCESPRSGSNELRMSDARVLQEKV